MASSKLNVKQLKFVQYFLQHGNATKAAEQAGYTGTKASLATTGGRMLKNAEISSAINDIKANSIQATTMTQTEVLEAFHKMAKFSPADVLEWKNGQLVFKTGCDLRLLDGAGYTIYPEYQTKDDKKDKIIRARLAINSEDKRHALELIGKHLGMWSKNAGEEGSGSGNDKDSRKNVLDRVSELLRRNKENKPAGGEGTNNT